MPVRLFLREGIGNQETAESAAVPHGIGYGDPLRIAAGNIEVSWKRAVQLIGRAVPQIGAAVAG